MDCLIDGIKKKNWFPRNGQTMKKKQIIFLNMEA